MKKLSDLVINLFEEEEQDYEILDDEKTFRTHFHGSNSSFSTYVFAYNEERLLRTYSKCPIKIPHQKLSAITELIARINLDLSIGNFDIDLEEGIVLFRTSMKICTENPGQQIIGTLIFGNCMSMDQYFPVIASVIYGNESPKQAVDLFQDYDDETTEEQEDKSSEKNSPTNINFNRRRGLFTDN